MTIFIIIFIIVIALVQFWSTNNALKGIKYDYRFSKKLIEIGETTEIISTITNESRRFVPFIRMVEALPKGVRTLNQKVFIREDTMGLGHLSHNSSVYLLARSKLQRKLKVTFDQRGRYVFRGAELRGGDFLGLTDKREKYLEFRELIVYPKKIEAPHLQEILGGFLGDISVRRFIMEDPILTIGTREYTGREPLKQMSWKHTARTNQMMVKQFDYTTEMVVTVLLDISTAVGKTLTPEQFENCFSLARTVCQFLDHQKIPFEYVSNAISEGLQIEEGRLILIQSLGKAHMRAILEQLGRAGYGTRVAYESAIENLDLNQEQNRSTIIITPRRDPTKHRLAQKLKEKTTGALIFIYGEDFDQGGSEYDIS